MKPLPETQPTPLAWPARLVARCLAIGFLLVWTAMTLFLDLMVATGFALGSRGEALFLALFSIPFNVILVFFWGAIVVKIFVSGPQSPWYGTGIRMIDRGHEVRFRLPDSTPVGAAFLAAFVFPILAVLPIGTFTGGKPSLPLAASAFALVLTGIVAAPVIVARRNARGQADLVIDRSCGTMTLPLSFGRSQPLTFLCADLIDIRVVTEVLKDSDGCVAQKYAVTAQWHDASGQLQDGTLVKLSGEHAAEELARAIRREKAEAMKKR